MDQINSASIKIAIESIPLLTRNNYSLWRIRVINVLDLIGLLDKVTKDS
jgi:hypothetical protein